jgi:hypothetical protein
VCGEVHEGLPSDWGFAEPAYWNDERDRHDGFLDGDLCVIRNRGAEPDYFVRGMIEIPILDGTTEDETSFGIGAWTSLSERNFTWYSENWEADRDAQGGAWFGWLSNSVPVYPETLSLKADVFLQGKSLRPAIVIQPSDHPLAIDQERGITLARARELSAQWLHL